MDKVMLFISIYVICAVFMLSVCLFNYMSHIKNYMRQYDSCDHFEPHHPYFTASRDNTPVVWLTNRKLPYGVFC